MIEVEIEIMDNSFGRKWNIVIQSNANLDDTILVSSSDFDQALKCTFVVEKAIHHIPWYSDISIWNISSELEQKIVKMAKEGAKVVVQAGYINSPPGTPSDIYYGDIFQVLLDRVNVTDQVLTLHCIDGLGIVNSNLASASIESGYDYTQLLQEIGKNSRKQFGIDKEKIAALDTKKFPRGRTVFAEPKDTILQIVKDNSAQFWFQNGKVIVGKLNDEYEGTAIVITPENGLVGTPQQMENGVWLKTLLRPEIGVKYPYMIVKLDNTLIRQQKLYQGQSLFSPLDQDGEYKVIKVRHLGDTRGGDWYTEVTGINLIGSVSSLLGYPN